MPGWNDPNNPQYARGGYTFVNGEWVRNDDVARNASGSQYDSGHNAANAPGDAPGQEVARDLDRWGKQVEQDVGTAGQWWDQNRDAFMGAYNPQQGQVNMNAGNLQSGVNGTAQAGVQQAAGPNGAMQGQSRDMQMALMQRLQDQAQGKGPSLAQMQLQKGTDANMSAAMALGQSQRGAGQAGMMKGIASQQANIGQGMANDAAMLRLQEQMQANQMLGSGLQGMRGQDLSYAGMEQQGSQFNAGQANQSSQFNAGQVNSQNVARQQAAMEAERLRQETQLAYEKMRAQAAKDRSLMGVVGGVAGAIGSM